MAGSNHPLRVPNAAIVSGISQLAHQSISWPKHSNASHSEKQLNQNVVRGGFRPIVLPKFVTDCSSETRYYGYGEAHKLYDEMRQFFAQKASSTHQNEVVVVKFTMMLLKPGYRNPQIVSV